MIDSTTIHCILNKSKKNKKKSFTKTFPKKKIITVIAIRL